MLIGPPVPEIQLSKKTDESTARWHLESLSGRSLHLTLVTKWSRSHMTLKIQISKSWPRSNPLSHLRPRVQIDVCFSFRGNWTTFGWDIANLLYLTLNIQGQGHSQGQIWWSHVRPRVQSMCLLFVSLQSDHFWQRCSQFHIWPWKFKVKIMAKVKPHGHIWGLEINWYLYSLFYGNRAIFGWDIANLIFDLENSRLRSWPRSNPMVTFEA